MSATGSRRRLLVARRVRQGRGPAGLIDKLYAAVDQGERSKHFRDLRALAPTSDQLLNAARWTRTHDPSPGFLGELRRILGRLGVEVSDGDV